MARNKLRGRAKRQDNNHAEIRDGLLKLGFDVDDVHEVPSLYDLVITGTGRSSGRIRTLRAEIKSGKRKENPLDDLTEDEKEFYDRSVWLENYKIVYDIQDVLDWFYIN